MIHLRKKKNEEHTPKVKKKTGIIQSILNPIGFAKKLYDDDQVMTNAATITLFMVMSLFPMLMILLWLMSRMMLSPEVLLKIVSSVLPEEMLELVTGIVSDLYEKSLSVSALSITIIMALWSSSTGISFLVKGLNRVYKREEQRNWFVTQGIVSCIYGHISSDNASCNGISCKHTTSESYLEEDSGIWKER